MLIYALKHEDCPWAEPPALVYAEEDWLGRDGENGLCPHCKGVDRGRFPKPLEIVLANAPPGELCCPVEGTQIVLWQRDFIAMIQEQLKDFVIGRCFLSDGSVLHEYVTCYGAKTVLVRGNRQSRYAICPVCRMITSEVKPGPEYILKRDLTEANVYQDAIGNFFFQEGLALSLDLSAWDKDEQNVFVEPIRIREEPADGITLPGDKSVSMG